MKYKLVVFLLILFTCLTQASPLSAQNKLSKPVVITGYFGDLKDGDKVNFTLDDDLKFGGDFGSVNRITSYSANIKNHYFKFSLRPISSIRMATIGNLKYPGVGFASLSFFVEPGDSVHITYSDGNYKFSGKNGAKYECWNELNKMIADSVREYSLANKQHLQDFYQKFDKLSDHLRRLLSEYKSKMSDQSYKIFEFNIYAEMYLRRFVPMIFFAKYSPQDCMEFLKDYKLPENYEQQIKSIKTNTQLIHYGGTYDFALQKYLFEECYVTGKPFDLISCYQFFKRSYTGPCQEWLITTLLMNYGNKPQNKGLSECISDALTFVKTRESIDTLMHIRGTTPGFAAYNFTLPDANGITRKMSDYKGKVIVMDFWFTGCGNCAELKPKLELVEKYFENEPKVVFFSICSDVDKKTWLKSVAGGKYTSAQSTNLFTQGLGYKHPIYSFYEISGAPVLLLVDKDGKIMPRPFDCRFDDGKDMIEKIKAAL